MGSIADKLTYLNGTKTAIKDAIIAKGGTVSDTTTFRNYATAITNLPTTKYGVSINDLLGDLDSTGNYTPPTHAFTLDLSGLHSMSSTNFQYRFYRTNVSGDLVIGLQGQLSVGNAFIYTFYNCPLITTVTFPSVQQLAAQRACDHMFTNCSGLTSISFPLLTLIQGIGTCGSMCEGCTSLTTVSFPMLQTVTGVSTMTSMFKNCTALTSISFPALETIAGTPKSQLVDMFSGCTALTEIHFRASIQATIESMTGYSSKFGATNATIYFDL